MTSLVDQLRRASERHRAGMLAAARIEAAARGKEAFDHAALVRLCGAALLHGRSAEELEHHYLVLEPRVMTLRELATRLRAS